MLHQYAAAGRDGKAITLISLILLIETKDRISVDQ